MRSPVPATIYTSEALVDLELQHNKFRGPLACPPHPEPKLSLLSLEVNEFSGGLPPCLFTSLPRLTSMDVSYNQLEGATLPPEIASSQHLTQLYAAASGLTGALPLQLKCMRRLTILSLANNDLGGEVAQPLIDGMTSLVTLDLQHNHFAGPIPHFDHAVNLRSIFLDHNSVQPRSGLTAASPPQPPPPLRPQPFHPEPRPRPLLQPSRALFSFATEPRALFAFASPPAPARAVLGAIRCPAQ